MPACMWCQQSSACFAVVLSDNSDRNSKLEVPRRNAVSAGPSTRAKDVSQGEVATGESSVRLSPASTSCPDDINYDAVERASIANPAKRLHCSLWSPVRGGAASFGHCCADQSKRLPKSVEVWHVFAAYKRRKALDVV